MLLKDRKSAGKELGQKLSLYSSGDYVVYALPRGGVPVGAEIAKTLDCPLDLVLVRKIGAPEQPELAIGAIAEDGAQWMNEELIESLQLSDADIEDAIERAVAQLDRQQRLFRSGRDRVLIRGKVVVIADDGLATGATIIAAIRSLKRQGADRIIVATPVCSRPGAVRVYQEADQLLTLLEPEPLNSIGLWYEDFTEVGDAEVIQALNENEARMKEIQEKREAEAAADSPTPKSAGRVERNDVEILLSDLPGARLSGEWTIPPEVKAWVIFAHGSGSSRKSPRNMRVAQALNGFGIGTLLFDLLTPAEADQRANVFDIPHLARRLVTATQWLRSRIHDRRLDPSIPIGYFGASTGAAAALRAADLDPSGIFAVVSRGGRPDLAGDDCLSRLRIPVLLLVGSDDNGVVELNAQAARLLVHSQLILIPGATHLFEEPGALEEVAERAGRWLVMQASSWRERNARLSA